MTLELACGLAISLGLLTLLVRQFRGLRRELTRGLRGLESLALVHDAELRQLREALQQQRQQGQQDAERGDERGTDPLPVRAVEGDQGIR